MSSTVRTYIDVVSVVFHTKNKVVLNNEYYSDKDKIVFSEEEVQEFHNLSQKEDLYPTLLRSVAPSIYGQESVKMGLLC